MFEVNRKRVSSITPNTADISPAKHGAYLGLIGQETGPTTGKRASVSSVADRKEKLLRRKSSAAAEGDDAALMELIPLHASLHTGGAAVAPKIAGGLNYAAHPEPSAEEKEAAAGQGGGDDGEEDPKDKLYDLNGMYMTRGDIAFLHAPSSFFVLQGDNIIRIRALQLIRSKFFQTFILGCILFSSLILGINWPAQPLPAKVAAVFTVIQDIFVCVFAFEAIVKLIALGALFHRGAYFRSGWNLMDFSIVVTSLLDLSGAGNGAQLKALRMFRVFRPLRSIGRVKKLKQLVGGLILAIPQVIDNFVLTVFVMIIFALFGQQLWSGLFQQTCFVLSLPPNDTDYTGISVPTVVQNMTMNYCGGVVRCDPLVDMTVQCATFPSVFPGPHHMTFNSFPSALLLMVKVVSGDNWPDNFNDVLSAFGYGAVAYFVPLVVIGTWYCLALFLAILTDAYSSTNEGLDGSSTYKSNRMDVGVQVDAEAEEDLFFFLNMTERHLALTNKTRGHGHVFEFNPNDLGTRTRSFRNHLARSSSLSFDVAEDSPAALATQEAYLEVFCEEAPSIFDAPTVQTESSDGAPTVQAQEESRTTEGSDTTTAFAASPSLHLSTAVIPVRSYLSDDEDEPSPDSAAEDLTIRKKIANFFESAELTYFMVFITAVNVLVLSMDYYGIPDSETVVLNIISLLCTALFGLEMIIKMWANGFKRYFASGLNRMDFLLIVVSIPDIAASGGGSSAFSALRVFRLLRLLRILRSFEGLQMILTCIVESIQAAAWLMFLIALFVYIYAILGMQLFGTSFNAMARDPNVRDSFGTLWEAALACFVVISGDNWTSRFFATDSNDSTTNSLSVAFFISLYVLGNFIFMNLFVAILLDKFSDNMEELRLEGQRIMPPLLLPQIAVKRRQRKSTISAGGDDQHLIDLGDAKEGSSSLQAATLTVMTSSNSQLIPADAESPKNDEKKGLHQLFFDQIQGQLFSIPMRLHRLATWLVTNATDDADTTLEGDSLFLLSPTNPARRAIIKLISSNFFYLLVTLVLLMNCIVLILDNPNLSDSDAQTIRNFNVAFTVLFCVEATLKMVGYGLIFPVGVLKTKVVSSDESPWQVQPAYFRDAWNVLDFIVAATALTAVWIPQFGIFRVLRTVRLLYRFESIKTVLISLAQALPLVVNGLILVFVAFFVLAILGVQLFKGKFYQCNDLSIEQVADCIGNYTVTVQDAVLSRNETVSRLWMRQPYHFDNVFAALLTVFVIGVSDGWSNIMYTGMDVTHIGGGLTYYASAYYCIYFVICFVVCNMIGLNIIIGILINYFSQMKEKNDGSAILTAQQRVYLKVRKAIEASAFVEGDCVAQSNPLSQQLHKMLSFKLSYKKKKLPLTVSEYLSMFAALINTIFIAMITVNSTQADKDRTTSVNDACLIFFTVDLVLRVGAYFPLQYLSSFWNVLDCVVVVVGWFDFFLPGVPALQFMRVFRMLRMIKGTSIAALLEKTLNSYQAFVNSLFLLILMFFAFAVVGVQIFGTLALNGSLTPTANFRSVPQAMITFFQIVTTEGWETMLLSCSNQDNCGGPGQGDCGNRAIATAFFTIFMGCCFCVCLNLLVAVIVDVVMDDTTRLEAATLDLFATLKEVWIARFGENRGKCSFQEFIEFLRVVPRTLTGMQRESRYIDMVHVLVSLQIPISSSMEVYYKDVVNGFAWRRFHIEIKTYGRIVHETLMNAISAQGFSVGEAYCAEVLQVAWREYKLRKAIGNKGYAELVKQSQVSRDICSLPSHRSVVGALKLDQEPISQSEDPISLVKRLSKRLSTIVGLSETPSAPFDQSQQRTSTEVQDLT